MIMGGWPDGLTFLQDTHLLGAIFSLYFLRRGLIEMDEIYIAKYRLYANIYIFKYIYIVHLSVLLLLLHIIASSI